MKRMDLAHLLGIVAASGLANVAPERQRSIPSEPTVKTIDVDQRERARRKHAEKLMRRLTKAKRGNR